MLAEWYDNSNLDRWFVTLCFSRRWLGVLSLPSASRNLISLTAVTLISHEWEMVRRVGANPLQKQNSKLSLKRLLWPCLPIMTRKARVFPIFRSNYENRIGKGWNFHVIMSLMEHCWKTNLKNWTTMLSYIKLTVEHLRDNFASVENDSHIDSKNEKLKHFDPKKKLVLSGVSALFTCSGALHTSFF